MSNDAHATGGKSQDLLYDPNIPTPTHGERAITLVSEASTGTLSTLAKNPPGFPYGSFVAFSLVDQSPVFLISDLAEHTKNLRNDSRASLLIVESADKEALANGRVTLMGKCHPWTNEKNTKRAREAYLSMHPNAAYYADFQDFSFWRLEVESVRYIGGFGRMSWVSKDDWLAAKPDPLTRFQNQIVDHMNEDHADTMVLYCKSFSRAVDATAAVMTSIDRYGFEMSATTAAGPRPIRVAFSSPISTPEDARSALVTLAKQARNS